MSNSVDYERTPGIETWEAATEGTVWVMILDARTNSYTKQRVGGAAGSKRLRISIDDRRYNEEQVVTEMLDSNPFRNGMLRLLRTDTSVEGYESDVDVTYHLTPEQYLAYFDLRDPAIFAEEMEGIGSELVLRRLKDLGEKHATMEQLEFLRELIEKRYTNHKSQKVVTQMEEDHDDGSVRLT